MTRIVDWVAIGLVAVLSSTASAEVPLPADISVTAPSIELRKELGAFSGKWEGNWSGNLDAILVVEKIDTETADILYAWGDAPVWNTKKGYTRRKAQVAQDGKAQLTFQNQTGTVHFSVTMNSDLSSINVQRTSPTGSAIETFKKATQ